MRRRVAALFDPDISRRDRVGMFRSPPPVTACAAPSVHLYFQPDGDVRSCCQNTEYPLGNIKEQRLREIWDGPRRQALRARLAVDDYSLGCEGCGWQVGVEGRAMAYARTFDRRAHHLRGDPASGAWPGHFEFNLSNACNLQCIQCNGELSSSIRIHREGRRALPAAYGDEFFEDLREFLPHLRTAQFAGGEPFMAAENYRVWDLIADEAPHVVCHVVTNATQWSARVERVLERIPMGFCFSVDGISRETYEAIRIGADFDQVMANIDRFCEYAHRVGSKLEMNFCLMVQNYHELPEVLVFAEARGIHVNVSVVNSPYECSIVRLRADDIARIHRELSAHSDRVLSAVTLNARTWTTELARIASWSSREEERPGGLLGFDVFGSGPSDDGAARAELEQLNADRLVYELTVVVGDAVINCTPATSGFLGLEPHALDGRGVQVLNEVFSARFGPSSGREILLENEDRRDMVVTFGDTSFRSVAVALRDDNGQADAARILFAPQPAR